MDWDAAKELLFTWLIPGIATYMAKQLRGLVKTFKEMNVSVTDLKKSVIELNEKMGTIVSHIENHEDRLISLERRRKKKHVEN